MRGRGERARALCAPGLCCFSFHAEARRGLRVAPSRCGYVARRFTRRRGGELRVVPSLRGAVGSGVSRGDAEARRHRPVRAGSDGVGNDQVHCVLLDFWLWHVRLAARMRQRQGPTAPPKSFPQPTDPKNQEQRLPRTSLASLRASASPRESKGTRAAARWNVSQFPPRLRVKHKGHVAPASHRRLSPASPAPLARSR